MKNRFNFLGPVVILALLFALVMPVPQLAAQQSPGSQPYASPQPAAPTPDAPAPSNEMKAFSGTIVKDGGKLVLKDTTNKVVFQLDDQSKAKDYVGKDVKVTGSLDASTNTIHVESIEAAS
jgi:hypothetical protein